MTKARLRAASGKEITTADPARIPPSKIPTHRSPRSSRGMTGNWKEVQKIFQTMNRGVIITDSQGRITQVNPAAETLTGLKRHAFLGKTLSALPWQTTFPDELPIAPGRMPDQCAIIEEQAILNAILGLKRPDGSTAWINFTATPLTEDDKKEVGAVVITLDDVTRVRQAEEALQNRNAILEAISFAAKRFLLSASWETCFPEIMERLGRATGVSRVYLFRNFNTPDGKLMTAQALEWSLAPDISQAENPECQVHAWYGGGMERWIPLLSQGEAVHGHVKDLPESERALLSPQEIKSILVVPVLVESNWWGFMGYDECTQERDWFPAEIDALKTAADTLGVAIERSHLEEERQRLQDSLQDALTRVLSGYLPICSVCKKIRDEHNQWRLVESYIRDHSDLVFSHGICPDCVEKFYSVTNDLEK